MNTQLWHNLVDKCVSIGDGHSEDTVDLAISEIPVLIQALKEILNRHTQFTGVIERYTLHENGYTKAGKDIAP